MKVYTIKFYFYGSQQIVPFDYTNDLLKFLHQEILGKDNKYHNNTSLYSVSPLFNSKTTSKGLLFERGAIWLIRTPSLEVFKDFYLKSKNAINKELGYGLVLKTVESLITKFDGETELVTGTSPVYLGQNENSDTPDHITYHHGQSLTTSQLKKTFTTKANMLGYNINEDDFNIEFDMSQPIKTKRVLVGSVSNIATQGKVRITGDPDVIGLCYGLGLGISTGCGFGFIFNIN